jgi:F420-dependent oxidoreductase-like protein
MTSYGLQLPNFSLGVPDDQLFERVAALAVAAEDSGFDSVWVMDHFWQLPVLGGSSQPMLESYSVLAALAARTRRVRLGALVTGVTYRNPAMLAKEVTTLDVISSGRAVLGIGAAWYEEEHRGLGFEFPPVAERFERLEEALQLCRLMFSEQAPSFAGRYYRVDGAVNLPRPVQPGGPRILIGGTGERRTLRLVAQYADLCNLFGGAGAIRHLNDVIDRHCADVGRDPAHITRTRLGSLAMCQSQEEGATLRANLATMMGGEQQVAEGFTLGTAEQIAEQVDALKAAGLDELYFNMPLANHPDQISQAGELLAKLG